MRIWPKQSRQQESCRRSSWRSSNTSQRRSVSSTMACLLDCCQVSGDIRPLAAGPLDGVVDHRSERQASRFSISKRASNELIGTGEACVSVSSCTKSQITYHFRIPETAQSQSCSPNPESSNYTAPCMNGWTFYCDMLQPSLITSTTS